MHDVIAVSGWLDRASKSPNELDGKYYPKSVANVLCRE
jgi:hypothetical protein